MSEKLIHWSLSSEFWVSIQRAGPGRWAWHSHNYSVSVPGPPSDSFKFYSQRSRVKWWQKQDNESGRASFCQLASHRIYPRTRRASDREHPLESQKVQSVHFDVILRNVENRWRQQIVVSDNGAPGWAPCSKRHPAFKDTSSSRRWEQCELTAQHSTQPLSSGLSTNWKLFPILEFQYFTFLSSDNLKC